MRKIENLESFRDDKKRALSCVALKKEEPLRGIREFSLILVFFLPRPR